MYNLIVVGISLIVPLIIIRTDIKQAINEKQSIKQYISKNKYSIMIYFIFVIGFLVRLLYLQEYPAGLNQDEASAGYDAYSILHYGMDRHGKQLPVYFIAWGSGQSTLCSYLMLPFIALFGLSELTIRLPMAIVGCITLIFIYKLLKQYNKKIAIIGLALFVICPWHIMKCRWALDCNLFPDMVIIAMCIIINALKNNKIKKFYLGIAFLSLSVYSYATSYMFLPIFILILLVYLLKTKKIKMRDAVTSLIIAITIASPMIIYVFINTFDYNEVKIGPLTIPRMYENRYEEATSLLSKNFFKSLIPNFMNNAKIILQQTDGLNYNGLPFYGIIYVFSLPFTIIGLYNCIRKRTLEKNILNICAISAILILFVYYEGNINRLNIVTVPMIIYTIIGIYDIIKNNRNTIIPIVLLYAISFFCFTGKYTELQGKNGSSFTQDLKEPLQYVKNLDVNRVYISDAFKQPYIYTLFYTEYPTDDFINTVEYNAEQISFESIKAFGKYVFYIPQDMNKQGVAYLVPIDYDYDKNQFKATQFEEYIVLERK